MDKSTRIFVGAYGSGKTEVYMQAIADVLSRGKGAIVLVPEISLTPQTVERFVARFGDRVAVLHSHLSDGERHDEWHRIRDGKADIVVGARSAVFAPLPALGLIVVDEEHDGVGCGGGFEGPQPDGDGRADVPGGAGRPAWPGFG